MQLPPELRINIYRHYFDGLNSYRLRKNRYSIAKFRPYLALLHADSQVRHEAAPIFYKEYMANPTIDDWRGWDLATRDRHTAMKCLKAIAQSLAEHNASVKVSVHFSSAVRIKNTIHEPLQSSSFVATMLDHIYSQVPCPRTDHESIVREYRQRRAYAMFVCPQYFPAHQFYDVRHVVGGFTVEYNCKWANGFYHETFGLDGPLAGINWTIKSAPTLLNNIYGYLANMFRSMWS